MTKESGRVTVHLMDCENVILREIEDRDCKRDTVALTYAFCLRSDEKIDYEKINKAIIARWSKSALNYIKTRAWKLHEGRIQP